MSRLARYVELAIVAAARVFGVFIFTGFVGESMGKTRSPTESLAGYKAQNCQEAYDPDFVLKYPLLHVEYVCKRQLEPDAKCFDLLESQHSSGPLERAYGWIISILWPDQQPLENDDEFKSRFDQCQDERRLYVDSLNTKVFWYLLADSFACIVELVRALKSECNRQRREQKIEKRIQAVLDRDRQERQQNPSQPQTSIATRKQKETQHQMPT